VSRRADIEEAFRIAGERYGTVHHLVNNAGTASLSLIRDCPEEERDLMVDTLISRTWRSS